MSTRWLITKRSDHGQYFRGLTGSGMRSDPVVAHWTPYPNGGIQYRSRKLAFAIARDIWGSEWRGAVRVVRRFPRGKR